MCTRPLIAMPSMIAVVKIAITEKNKKEVDNINGRVDKGRKEKGIERNLSNVT